MDATQAPRRKHVIVRITEEERRLLTRAAHRRGCDVTHLIRTHAVEPICKRQAEVESMEPA